MKTAIIALLLIASVFGANMRNQSSAKKIEQLKESRWGNTLLTFMQLHSAVKGPVQELVDAIEELIQDLNESLQELEFDFQQRTNQHNALVIELEQEIQDADSDIARMEDVINNLLVPRKAQIEQRIHAVNENIEFNRKTLAEDTLVRQQEHEEYEAQIEELNEATAAVDEALALLETLSNPSPSMIQIKKFKSAISRISKKAWKKVKQGPMVQALLQIAVNQNFSDQGIVKQIVQALLEFRNEVVDGINHLTAQEAENVAAFEERVVQLDDELRVFQGQINDLNVDLTATIEKMEECTSFLNQRTSDRGQYVAQLDLENESYANETEIYTDLKNEYLRELAVSEQAYNLVSSADFSNINVY